MKKIDYSKWYGSKLCPFCVKKLKENDLGIREAEVSVYRGTSKVKVSYCKECGTDIVIFPSPARVVFGSIATAILMSGLFGLMFLGAEDTSTFAITGAASAMIIGTLGIIGILIYTRNKGKDVIKQIESTN
jgi:hypothetical protein